VQRRGQRLNYARSPVLAIVPMAMPGRITTVATTSGAESAFAYRLSPPIAAPSYRRRRRLWWGYLGRGLSDTQGGR
jgi:hypothetical protein